MGAKRNSTEQIVRGNEKRVKRTPMSTAAVAREALKKVNRIEREVESKAIDTFDSAALVAAGVTDCVSVIAQGIARNERTGNVVTPTKLEVAMTCASSIGVGMRLLIVQVVTDFQPTPVAGAGAEVLIPSGDYMSQVNFDNRKYFTILYDKVYTIASPDATDFNIVQDVITVFPKRKCVFDLATPTQTTGLQDGSIWVLSTSDGGAASIITRSRLWFKDA